MPGFGDIAGMVDGSVNLNDGFGFPNAGGFMNSGFSMPDIGGFLGNNAGSLFAGALGYIGGQQTNAANAQQASNQMDFQERMSSTAYQRAVKDMEAAGLNPMLAYSQGGASSPTGASAIFQNPATQGAAAASSAAQIQNIQADTANKSAQGELFLAQAAAARGSAFKANADVELVHKNVQDITAKLESGYWANESERTRKTADMLVYQAGLMRDQGMTQQETQKMLRAQVEKLVADKNLTITDNALRDLDLQAARDMGNIGREAGQWKPVIDILRMFLRR